MCFVFFFNVCVVGIDFLCNIPERYPDEAPGVGVEATKGLTPKQCEELLLLAQAQVRVMEGEREKGRGVNTYTM